VGGVGSGFWGGAEIYGSRLFFKISEEAAAGAEQRGVGTVMIFQKPLAKIKKRRASQEYGGITGNLFEKIFLEESHHARPYKLSVAKGQKAKDAGHELHKKV